MSGGGGSPQQQTTETKQVLSPEQQQILGYAMPGIKDFAAKVPERYQGNQVAPFTEPQVAGQQMALGAAAPQADIASGAAHSVQNFYKDIWNPADNPNLRGAISAATAPIQENLTQSTLPAIRSDAENTGNFGASRQGIAEGLASTGASRAIGETGAKLAQSTYDTNIDAQLKALGLAPTVQGAQLAPATTTSGVGDVQQALNQANISQDVGNFNYDQYAPFLQSQELASLVSGIPGGGSTSTSTATQPRGNTASTALGGAAAGASLGTALMPGIGTAAGAGLGAILPFLFR